jgi:ferredoxin--NADP+ reductase
VAKPLEYNAVLVYREDLTDKLAIFRVAPDPDWAGAVEGSIPDFNGGQYTVLGLNNSGQPDKGSVQRAYSIASPPEEKDYLEFYIRYVDEPASDNPLTHLLWNLAQGDRIYLGRKITGHFCLEKTVGHDDPRLKIFVAAGTGLAPFVSILLSYIRRGLDPGRFMVLHGASRPQDLGYGDELATVFRDFPQRYSPTISRPQEAPGWSGDLGRVETFFDEKRLPIIEERLGLEVGGLVPERAVVYVCGLYGTIHNTLVSLMRRGFVPSDRKIRQTLGLMEEPPSLFFEQYDSEPILDVDNKAKMDRLMAQTPFASSRQGDSESVQP